MAKKTLIIFYSQARGNTKRIAEMIHDKTGFDMVQIDTVKPYTGSYDKIVDQGQREINRGFKPELKSVGIQLDAYDNFIIGTPTWWYTMAPAVKTFLESNNWSGKNVFLFQTHGGWPGHVITDMEESCKGAKVLDEMQIQFDSTGGDQMVTTVYECENWITALVEKLNH